MQFTLRKVGNSIGVIIPKAFVEQYRNGDFIELHFAGMSRSQQEAVAQAIPIDPPADFNLERDSQTVEEVIVEDAAPKIPENPTVRQVFDFTLCKKHKGYKGSCHCA